MAVMAGALSLSASIPGVRLQSARPLCELRFERCFISKIAFNFSSTLRYPRDHTLGSYQPFKYRSLAKCTLITAVDNYKLMRHFNVIPEFDCFAIIDFAV